MAKFIKVSGKDIGSIKLYALSTCGWCKKTKAFLNDKGISYVYTDVDKLNDNELADVRKEQLLHNPSGSFPTIVINDDQCIVGFDKEALDALVESSDGR